MTDYEREIMQQALEALGDSGYKADPMAAAAALRAALAEPEQEPVAKVELMATGGNAGLATRIVEIDDHLRERLRPGQLLYTTPPARRPLTDEEIDALWRKQVYGFNSATTSMLVRGFARNIERKITGGNDE